MILQLQTKEIEQAMKNMVKIVPKAENPVEKGVLLEADDARQQLKITGQNFETAVLTRIDAEIQQPGSIVINAHLLYSILQKWPESQMYMKVSDGHLHLAVDSAVKKSEFSLRIFPGSQYNTPVFPRGDIVRVMGLKTMVSRTAPAAESAVRTGGNRRLHGIHFILSGNTLTAYASDGGRIVSVCAPGSGSGSFMAPAAPMRFLSSIARDEDIFELSITHSGAVFYNGTDLIAIRSISSECLTSLSNASKSVQMTYSAVCERQHLLDAVSRATSYGDILEIRASGSSAIVVCSRTSEKEQFTAEVPAENIDIPDRPFYFRSKWLKEHLQAYQADSVTLHLADNGSLLLSDELGSFFQLGMRVPISMSAAA